MLETVFSEDFRGEQFPQFLQFLLEQFMYLETLFSYTLLPQLYVGARAGSFR